MKIGINASFLRKQNTGIGQVTVNFIKKLTEFPNNAEFILYLEEDTEIELPANFTKKVFLPPYKRDDLVRKIWWEMFLLPRMVKKDGCDVFLSLYQCPTVMSLKIVKKHLMLAHDVVPRLFPQYLGNMRKKSYWKLTERGIRRAAKIIVVSKRTEKDLVQHLGIDPAKITVSYIATDDIYKKEVSEEESTRILQKYGLEKGYIYTGGGLDMRKNMEGTIQAYKILLDQSKDEFAKLKQVPVLVVSGKLMPQLAPLVTDAEALVNSLGIGDKVKFLGFVPQDDLPALYKNAALFAYPSFYEGFGLPILEAMCQGLPVVTAKKSSLPEVGGDAVLYCDPSDAEEIARVMKKILSDGNLRQTLSTRGKQRSLNFSWDKFANKVLRMLASDISE